MNDARAKTTNMCMSDAMPFNQHWEYWDTCPVSDMLDGAFFLPVRAMLRAGDQVCLTRFDDTRETLLEIATVRVVRKIDDPEAKCVELVLIGDVHRPAANDARPADGDPYIKPSFGKFLLRHGDETLSKHDTREQAEAALGDLKVAA